MCLSAAVHLISVSVEHDHQTFELLAAVHDQLDK